MKKLLGSAHVDGETHFRVWAPEARKLEVIVGDAVALALEREADGYFAGTTRRLRRGDLYKYRVDGAGPWPDPCSRFQPEGPHGPSMIVSRDAFEWSDRRWRGVTLAGQVLYELHIGTFTTAGTFDAAMQRLPWLRDLGVTAIEVMPVAECPGRWNWGYDGVQFFAPWHVYGDYDAFKRFVDRAHALGLAVILDLVYNHLGPDGNYLGCFSPYYSSTRHRTDWGAALNFDGEHSRGVRDFVVGNGCYWIEEFHLDGFRLDATHAIYDTSERHVLTELVSSARQAAGPRTLLCFAEDELQRGANLQPPEQGGHGLDAIWNDDYHHAARVALTGSRDAWFRGYRGRAQELISAVKRGFLYQGQYDGVRKTARGSPVGDRPAAACVAFLQNHDQVGHTFRGDRLHTFVDAAQYRALTALTLLAPQTPLLFMGQEFLASTRFAYFADHNPQLAPLVFEGRREFMKQFAACATPEAQAQLPDPGAESTFAASKLDWREVETHARAVALHRDLLALRASDPVIARQDAQAIDGATLSEHAFLLRWFDAAHGDRLLIVNLDRALTLDPAPEPLLAAPLHSTWELVWSSDDIHYDGRGVSAAIERDSALTLPAGNASFFRARIRN